MSRPFGSANEPTKAGSTRRTSMNNNQKKMKRIVGAVEYTTSDGEKKYQLWARVTQVVGWSLFACALIAGLFYRDRSRW